MKTILNLIQANAEITNLRGVIESNDSRISELEASIEALQTKHSEEIEQIKEAHANVVKDANAKVELLTEANHILEEKQTSAEEQAVQVMASVGVEQPVEEAAENSVDDKSIDELWAEYKTIESSKEQRAFYLEHIKPLR